VEAALKNLAKRSLLRVTDANRWFFPSWNDGVWIRVRL
jgi:hypothetical protein